MRPLTLEQTPQGFATLQQRLQATGVLPTATLVVLEATVSYWITLATTLHHAGYQVRVINPAQAHHFAKALLKRAKTDAIDAATLTQLAALLQPKPWTPPPTVYHELQQRLAQRETLLAMRQQLRNQLHALSQGPVVIAAVRRRMETLIVTLTTQVEEVDGELTAALQMDAAWAAAAERLQSSNGSGAITAGWLLVTTLNFSHCATAEAATAYAGLAPVPRESGSSVRNRRGIGHAGNARLRTALYMATLSAAQHNPMIKTFYRRLRDAGKPKKVARCAAARKLLHSAFAVVTKEQRFDPSFKPVSSGTPTAVTVGA
ncbi:MAG: IS110 family transposase [Chloroflexota bacterium]|nr:IS110 family transposase [Chloroflexota bacterium]